MQPYTVTGILPDGRTLRVQVDALDRDEAMTLSGFPAGRVASVRRAVLARAWHALRHPRPRRSDQALFLSSLSSLVVAGQSLTEGVQRLLTQIPSIRPDAHVLRSALTASAIAKALRFEPQVVMLTRAGEESGDLVNTLAAGAEHLIRDEELRAEMRKHLVPGFILLGLGGAYMIGVPLGFGWLLQDILSEPGLQLDINPATTLVLALHDLYVSKWFVLLAAGVLGYTFRARLWDRLRRLPGLRFVWEFQRLKRGILFLTAYQPLYHAGVSPAVALAVLRRQGRNADAPALDAIAKRIRRGHMLSASLQTDDWPRVLRSGLAGFESMTSEAQRRVLANTVKIMRTQEDVYARRVAASMYALGITLAVLALFLMFAGVILPLQTIHA